LSFSPQSLLISVLDGQVLVGEKSLKPGQHNHVAMHRSIGHEGYN
jgi:hypothetical protein